jgi:PAS domain S-box-containing protein
MAPNTPSSQGLRVSLLDLLRAQKDRVLQRWIERVKSDPEIPEARRLADPDLIDHVPLLLDHVIQSLERLHATEAEAVGTARGPATSHAIHRISEAYTIEQALREIAHVRGAVLDVCDAENALIEPEDAQLFHAMLDEGMRTVAIAMERTARADLEDNELRLRLANEAAGVGTWDYDPATRVLRADARGRELFGLPPEAEVTEEVFWSGLHPQDLDRTRKAVRRAHDPASGGEYRTEYRTIGYSDRAERWVAALGRMFFDGARPIRFIGITLDITERKRAEVARTEESRFRERFMGILGHDLRTPLTAIVLAAAVLAQRANPTEHEIKALTRITSAAERMRRMIVDLLDLTRSRLGGGLPIHPRPVDLGAVCGQVLDELRAAHPTQTIAFTCHGDAQGTWDPDRLSQVIINLTENALDFSPPGAPVRVEVEGEGGDVHLSVNNQGPIIPLELRTVVFDPFRRGADHERTSRSGLGLGLFIAREIVSAHGGSIDVASDGEHGTTFTFRLPRQPPPPRSSPR